MKSSNDKKITPVKPASLEAQAILLNVMEKLAQDDSDDDLKAYVVRERQRQLEGTPPPITDNREINRESKKGSISLRKRLLWAAGIVVMAYGYLFLSSPTMLVVGADGDVNGVLNVLRLKVQGQHFWNEQLVKAKASLDWELAAPQREEERQRRVEKLSTRVDHRLEETYQQYPQLRPSPSEEEAESLRAQADLIEQAETKQTMEKYRVSRIEQIQHVVELLESRHPATRQLVEGDIAKAKRL